MDILRLFIRSPSPLNYVRCSASCLRNKCVMCTPSLCCTYQLGGPENLQMQQTKPTLYSQYCHDTIRLSLGDSFRKLAGLDGSTYPARWGLLLLFTFSLFNYYFIFTFTLLTKPRVQVKIEKQED